MVAMKKKPPTKSGIQQEHSGDTFSDPKQLAAAIRKDRLKRNGGMTWPAYAAWIGVKLSTIYKIARGATRLPHELTINKIQNKWAAEPIEGGAGSEVVSGGQRHPERSEG